MELEGEVQKMDNHNQKKPGDEKRSYFRVNDVINVVAIPVNVDRDKAEEFLRSASSSRAFPLLEIEQTSPESADNLSSDDQGMQKLLNTITELKTKVDFIINHLIMEREGLLNAEKKLVNISASGIRFTVDQQVKVGDIMEVKLLLPTYPPVAVFAYGKIKRAAPVGGNKFDIALEYVNMGDTVRNEIIQYALSHQRETIRKIREENLNE